MGKNAITYIYNERVNRLLGLSKCIIKEQNKELIGAVREALVESKDGKPVCAYSTAAKEKTPSYSLDKAQKKAFPLLAEKILQEMKF